MDKLRKLRQWRRAEFKRRTALLQVDLGRIDWLDPGTRVSFSEVCEKARELGIDLPVTELRLAIGKK